jgi:orotidine-5'-phosphate decarboxylase
MFIDDLMKGVHEKNNPTVVGLDPVFDYVPRFLKEESFRNHGKNLKGAASAIWEFNKRMIDEVSDLVAAVKLQFACYEMYGLPGLEVFLKTSQYAKEKGLLVIGDGKRNDIGSSAGYYAKAYLGKTKIDEEIEESAFGVDALTVNPYLGEDGIKPFVEDCRKYGKGIFVLVKTSNESSGQLQDISCHGGKMVYKEVGRLVKEWGKGLVGEFGYSEVGAVVGATYPEQAKVLRDLLEGVCFLVPGYGAQGASAKDLVPFFDKNKKGAIINASRSILLAYQSEIYQNRFSEEEFAKASKMEVIRMRDEIQKVLA